MASVAAVIQQHLIHFLEQYNSRRILIAYSGGVDSSVLLHSVMGSTLADVKVSAVHINHYIHKDSNRWEQHCRVQAQTWGCDFSAVSVTVPSSSKVSPEEAARIVRYQALCRCLRENDLLLTAHHADDQAETLLLQLLRGSGPQGLAAMPEVKPFGPGYLLRPMLDISQLQIMDYAREQGLQWITDPTNADLRFDRNYIRHRVGPVLAERWPQWNMNVKRAAEHQRSVLGLLKQKSQDLLDQYQSDDGTLNVADCLILNDVEKQLLIRHWLGSRTLPIPNKKQLDHLIRMFLSQTSNASGLVGWPGGQVRRYRGRLYAMEPLPMVPQDFEAQWRQNTDIEIPEIRMTLKWQQLLKQAPEYAEASLLIVRFRRGGEKCPRFGGKIHQPLRKLFQELGVPPWLRDRIPLVYINNELRILWNLKVCR